MVNQRKFQLSNGYTLEFEQLARVLSFLAEKPDAKKIARPLIMEGTGLTERHVETLVSMGSAMGLIHAGAQILTEVGRLVAKHDVFIQSRATLEWCHYMGAGSFKNLIWFEVFNTFLPAGPVMTASDWMSRLRVSLAGQYSEKTLAKNLRQEIHFIEDSYLNRNLAKLELLHRTTDGRVYLRRYTQITPAVFAAMLYELAARDHTDLLQTKDILEKPGSPGLVFGMDEVVLRQAIEAVHEHGWVRFESTHNLDQIRLKEGFSALSFLQAHYAGTEPKAEEAVHSPNRVPSIEERDLFA
jgi:hypothetical protein